MLRSYRGILVAFAGLALVGAAPQPDGKKADKTASAQQQVKETARTIPGDDNSLEQIEGAKLAEPCGEGQDNRNSDLCAQWKAADAASKAAWWTVIGTIVAGLGTAGVIATIFYARGSIIASVNAERPHVRFYRTIKARNAKGEITVVNGINFRNYGRTPARVRSLSLKYQLATSPPLPETAGEPRIWPEDSIMPQDEEWPRKNWIGPFDKSQSLSDLVSRHDDEGERLFAFGELRYFDAFGKERLSKFCRVWDGDNFTYNTTDIAGDKRLNYST